MKMQLSSPKRRGARVNRIASPVKKARRAALAAGLVLAFGAGAAPTTASASTHRYCDECLVPSHYEAYSTLAFRVTRNYAHNLGGGTRNLCVFLSNNTFKWCGNNTVYHDYSGLTYSNAFAFNNSSYNVRMNAHATVGDV